jgi:hypothetical protein
MAYPWNRDTISVSEIITILFEQYDQNPTISVPIADGNKQFNYKKELIPVQCNRCGNKYQITPQLLLSMKDDRGYSCSKCGNLTVAQLREQQRVEMLKAGRDQLVEMGIDPDKEDEEEKEKKEYEEEEKAIAKAMIEDGMELLDVSEIEKNEAVIPQEASVETQVIKSQEIPKAEAPIKREIPVENKKEDTQDIPFGKFDEENDDFNRYYDEQGTENNTLNQEGKLSSSDKLKQEVEASFDDEVEGISGEELSKIVNAELSIKEMLAEEDELDLTMDDDEAPDQMEELIDESDLEGDEDEQSDWPEVPDDISPDRMAENIDESDLMGDDEYPLEKIFSEEKMMDDISDGEDTLDSSDSEEDDYMELGGKRYTKEELTERFNEIQTELSKTLGYIPYGKTEYEEGVIAVSCNICGNKFDVNTIETLLEGALVLDKEGCIKYGLKYKSNLKISSCPHCKTSIFTNGYNAYYRKQVESVIAKAKLNIVKPESYWYAYPFANYSLEANGIVQNISYFDLCNKYKGMDMSKHELFTPRGTATKSEATSVENNEGNQSEGVFTIPKHNPKSQFHLDAHENSPEIMFERQQKKAESQWVFHKEDKAKKFKGSIAVLNGKENPFEREERLEVSFKKTIFYDFIKELAEECNVKFRFQIDQRTFQIPVVDFEPYMQGKPGFRLVCAQYDRDTMFNVPFNRIAKSIPFQFNNRLTDEETPYQYSVLYSDSVFYREKATFNALIKYINPTVLAYGGRRIQLEGNLNIQYTDYKGYLTEFSEDCSPFPDGKPSNRELGILASWVSTKNFDAKDILETLNSLEGKGNNANLDKLESDMGLYMVCSIKYIEQLNKDTQRVIYTITEYIEIGGALIADGLYQCVKALLKEYYTKYPNLRDRTPHVIIEIDTNSYTSPSLKSYVRNKSILPVDRIYRSALESQDANNFYTMNMTKKHLKYVYMRRNANRSEHSSRDNMRQDIRKFNAIGLIKRMPEEIKAAGLQMGIYDDTQRLIFIRNMGFTEATQLEIKEYFMSQGTVQMILLDGNTLLLPKAINPDSMYNAGGIVGTSNDSLRTINDPMYNPLFRAKMERIRMGYTTPEAQDFYQSYLQQKQQQEMANNMNWMASQNQAQQFQGIWQAPQAQQKPPVMTQGAYYMPNVPGMSYK